MSLDALEVSVPERDDFAVGVAWGVVALVLALLAEAPGFVGIPAGA